MCSSAVCCGPHVAYRWPRRSEGIADSRPRDAFRVLLLTGRWPCRTFAGPTGLQSRWRISPRRKLPAPPWPRRRFAAVSVCCSCENAASGNHTNQRAAARMKEAFIFATPVCTRIIRLRAPLAVAAIAADSSPAGDSREVAAASSDPDCGYSPSVALRIPKSRAHAPMQSFRRPSHDRQTTYSLLNSGLIERLDQLCACQIPLRLKDNDGGMF